MRAEIAEEQLLAAAFYGAVILRLKNAELRLHGLGKRFAFGICVRVKHLCAAVLRIGKLILVDRHADCVFRRIQNRKPIVHVGAFLVCNALDALVVDRAVAVARDLHLVAGCRQQRAQIQQDVQVDALLRNPCRGGAAAVDAAVRRINLN